MGSVFEQPLLSQAWPYRLCHFHSLPLFDALGFVLFCFSSLDSRKKKTEKLTTFIGNAYLKVKIETLVNFVNLFYLCSEKNINEFFIL